MSAPFPAARRSRGKLLLAGHAAHVDGLDASVRDRVLRVRNIYEAVGEIATSTASAPVEAVIVDAHEMTRPLPVVVEAIRNLDPNVFVYALLRSEDDADGEEAADAGFDGLLVAPLTPSMIAGILDAETEEDSAVEPAPIGAPSKPEVSPSPPQSEPPAGAAFEPTDAIEGGDAPPSTAPVQEDVMLGDSDLVEAALSDPERLPDLALRLLVQETGWSEARLIAPDEPVPQGCASAEVAFSGEHHGRLATSMADARALTPWAGWLARWLSLAKSQHELRAMALTDPLTGAWNRRFFESFLPRRLEEARRRRRPLTLMVFDVDDLKVYNDRYGHEAGDVVLRETVRLLNSVIRRGDRVCRIGGDEFVVIFADDEPPRRPGSVPIESIEKIVRRFQSQICELRFPKLGPEAPGTLSISAGLATFPWDGHDAETLLRAADRLAMESKRKGKNALTIGPGAETVCRGDAGEPGPGNHS